jgi:hypothetical protein
MHGEFLVQFLFDKARHLKHLLSSMNMWTKERLTQLTKGKIEETAALEFKGAGALAKNNSKTDEITKDVSAFANSSGGTLIYGITETRDKTRPPVAQSVDPISRTDFPKEWLEQIIQSIQPRIEGYMIHAITIDEVANSGCYVVEIPQSHTAHQARDKRYYKRHNFTVLPMEDYEIRDVMNRRTHPRINVYLRIEKEKQGRFYVRLENVGRIIARDYMVRLELPINIDGYYNVAPPFDRKRIGDEHCYVVNLTPWHPHQPLFPGSDTTLSLNMDYQIHAPTENGGRLLSSTRLMKISVFADEMPSIEVCMDYAPLLFDWKVVEALPRVN